MQNESQRNQTLCESDCAGIIRLPNIIGRIAAKQKFSSSSLRSGLLYAGCLFRFPYRLQVEIPTLKRQMAPFACHGRT